MDSLLSIIIYISSTTSLVISVSSSLTPPLAKSMGVGDGPILRTTAADVRRPHWMTGLLARLLASPTVKARKAAAGLKD